jgi:uncharacterized membrane protein
MEFWVYMLIVNLAIPVVMIVIGGKYAKKAPENINGSSGYKTALSRKNRDTWEFANRYFGKIWHIAGWSLLVPTFAVMLLVFGKGEDAVGRFGGIVCGVLLVAMLIPILPTEIALRKNFDKNGNRKERTR